MKYSLSISDVKDYQDEPPWRSFDLESTGNTLEELLANAVYLQTDQDGGELGEVEADDDLAEELIKDWFEKNRKTWFPRLAKNSEISRCHKCGYVSVRARKKNG